MPIIIGLTGGSGSGKSFAANFFRDNGYFIIDLDEISRLVYKENNKCITELVNYFGKDILNNDDSLNRKKLGEIVFSDKEKLLALNKIVHKYILEKMLELLKQNKDKNIVLDAPLLFQTNINSLCNKTISIIANDSIRIERIMKRDNISKEYATNRIKSQPDNSFYIKNSNFVIENNDSTEDLLHKLENVLNNIKISGC